MGLPSVGDSAACSAESWVVPTEILKVGMWDVSVAVEKAVLLAA